MKLRRPWSTLLLVAVLTTGCGSTVATRSTTTSSGLGLPDNTVPGPSNAGSLPPGATQPPADASQPGTSSTTPAVTSQSAAPVPGAQLDGPGVTANTITVGATYTTDSGQADSAAGAGGIDPGDMRNYYNAVIDDVNRSGGIAGRKVVPAYFQMHDTSTDSQDSQLTAACEHWASDVKAFVMLDAVSDTARSCAEQHGMLSLFTGGGNSTARTFRAYPHYLEPSSIALDRYAVATVNGLAQTDYYGAHPVIGVITWDDPSYRAAVNQSMLPALHQLGYDAKDVYDVKVASSMAGISDSSAAISSAILRFRQDGVTHVFIVDGPAGVFGGTGLTLLFIKAASSQRYFPRYGMNDNNSPQAGLDSKLWQPSDVEGSRAVTWSDIDDKSDAGVATNLARKQCFAVMARHGLDPSNVNAQVFMLKACDYIWFLRTVLGTTRIAVNRDVFVTLANGLGLQYRSPMSYRTAFSSTQHDGIAGFRRQALDDACGCYRYTSGVYS